MAIVIVKPIEKNRWHNNPKIIDRPVVLHAAISLSTGKYATGLTEEDRERLEKLTGYNLSPEYINGVAHEFWDNSIGKIKLSDGANVFDTNKPLDYIKLQILKANDLVANSQKEFDEGLFPYAKFIIYDEEQEQEIKAAKVALKNRVILEVEKLSNDRKIEIIQIILNISAKGQSSNFISLKMEECIEKAGAEQILSLINENKARVTTKAFILEALNKNILRKEGTSVYYLSDQIGFDIDSTIDYFLDKNNQSLKAQIINQLYK